MPIRIDRHDSALGQWLLARWEPPRLADLIDGIWYFEGSLTHLRERHFPTGRAELVVQLGPVYGHVEGDAVTPFPTACVSGLILGPDVIQAPPGRTSVLGIGLRPAGAFAVLGHPLEPLTGITVDLEDLAGGEARRLVDRCAEARTSEGRLRAAAAWIEQRARSGPGPDPAVEWMTRTIEGQAGDVGIGDLTERTGWSSTRLTETFRTQVGVTPKRFGGCHAEALRPDHALPARSRARRHPRGAPLRGRPGRGLLRPAPLQRRVPRDVRLHPVGLPGRASVSREPEPGRGRELTPGER